MAKIEITGVKVVIATKKKIKIRDVYRVRTHWLVAKLIEKVQSHGLIGKLK